MICRYCARIVDSLPWPDMCARCLIDKLPELNHDHRLDRTSLVLKWLADSEDGRAWMVKTLQSAGWVVFPRGLADEMREVQERTARMARERNEVTARLAGEVTQGDDNEAL